MPSLFSFVPSQHAGLRWYVMSIGDLDFPAPIWPGLTGDDEYPDSPNLNPFWRYAVNAEAGEALALWRALAWAITEASVRAVLPRFDRDEVARFLRRPPKKTPFIKWEYEVDYKSSPFERADHGFVPAQSSLPISPSPSTWQRRHQNHAGLFPVRSLAEFHRSDAALSFDVASEMSLIGTVGRTFTGLQQSLSGATAPQLGDVLGPDGVFAHFTVVRDRFFGHHSYFAIASQKDLSQELTALVRECDDRWARYCSEAHAINSFDGFVAAMERMTSLRGASPTRPLKSPLPLRTNAAARH